MRIDSRIPKIHTAPLGADGDAWELDGDGALIPVENSFGVANDNCWQSDNDGDIMPKITPGVESLWETDGDGYLQPV